MKDIQGNLIAGVLTVIPLLIVWIVVEFIFSFLFAVGAPMGEALRGFIAQTVPSAAPFLANPFLQWLMAVVVALLLLYTIGAAASRVVGIKLLAIFESLIARIPVVQTIYSASKKLIGMLQQKPEGSARVVLIDFPHKGMKVVGLVTRTFTDAQSGEEIAAVYVPTTPNPTSGYLELVPLKDVVPTSMTLEQAMTMIVSGGAILPNGIAMGPENGSPRTPP